MDQKLLVSIIVNNYNYDRYLAEAIESALSQTYQPVEVIVVDDGSTDRSRQIITAYGDRIVPVFKENGGQASAFNAGFERCRGEVVIFLDADDMLMPDAAENLAAAFEDHPQAAKLHFRMQIVDRSGNPTGMLKPPAGVAGSSGDLRREELAFPFDLRWLPTSGNAFASWALRLILPAPEESYGRVCADYYLVHLSALYGPVIFLDRALACYRTHGGNSFDVPDDGVTLAHLRQSLYYIRLTNEHLKKAALTMGLGVPRGEISSVSEIASRFISYKSDPGSHPVAGDSTWKLLRLGLAASLRRFDVSFPKRIVFMAWFLAMGFAPRTFCWDLAQFFFNPQARGVLNRLPGVKAA